MDMDGVLADFVSGTLEACELPILAEDVTHWGYYEPFMSTSEFWRRIDEQMCFWEDLPVYPWAHDLWEMVNSFGDVIIASSPSMHPDCVGGKLRWLRRHGFLKPSDQNYMFGPQRFRMAREGAVLIDDSDDQCRRFWDAGGKAIVFPQKWNSNASLASSDVGQVSRVAHVYNYLNAIKAMGL